MAKLSKESINDAISIIKEFESPECFFDKEKLAQTIESHFDCEVDREDVLEYVQEYNEDAIDRFLTLKNILQ